MGRSGLGADPPSEDVFQAIIQQEQAERNRRRQNDAQTQTSFNEHQHHLIQEI